MLAVVGDSHYLFALINRKEDRYSRSSETACWSLIRGFDSP